MGTPLPPMPGAEPPLLMPPPSPASDPVGGPAPALPGPDISALWNPAIPRPITAEDTAVWVERVNRGVAKREQFEPQWQRGLDSYAKALAPAPKDSDRYNALLSYRHVESRKAQLFHKTPDVNLVPIDPPAEGVPVDALLPLREKALNHELGPDRANLKGALHETLIDCVAASAFLVTLIGFEQVLLPVPGQVGPNGQPVSVPIWSRRFITPISSKKLVIPAGFVSTRFDEAPWLAVQGVMPIAQAKRLGWTLPADYAGSVTSDTHVYDHGASADTANEPQVAYTLLYYKASLYDEAVFNPELYRCLVLVDGADVAVWHRDCPFQSLDPTGAVTDDSMQGNPIHVGTIRTLPDSAYVPSDLVVGEQLAGELGGFRTGLVRNRRARRPVTLISDKAGQALIDKVAANAGPIPTPDEYFDGAGGQRLIAVVGGGTEPRDNYTAQTIIEHDWQTAMGTGDNQSGNVGKRSTTATEAKLVQGNSSARARTDEDRVRDYVVALVRKFDAVWQRTATERELTKVLGQAGAQLWQQWQAMPGTFAYAIQPDAGRYVDADEYRVQKVNEYNLLRKDPILDAVELDKQVVTALGYDAGKLVKGEMTPKPEPVKINLALSMDKDSAPAEVELNLSLLQQSGYEIPPELAAKVKALSVLRAEVAKLTQAQPGASPEHGGSADRTEPINKHSSERTGGLPGMGRIS